MFRQTAPRARSPERGSEPDPRFTLANERTFLAWNRTALGLIGGGLVVEQFTDFRRSGLRLAIALPLLILGAVMGFASHREWQANQRALRLKEALPTPWLPLWLSVGVGLVAVIATVVLVLDVVA